MDRLLSLVRLKRAMKLGEHHVLTILAPAQQTLCYRGLFEIPALFRSTCAQRRRSKSPKSFSSRSEVNQDFVK
jgi:hypothetical protein